MKLQHKSFITTIMLFFVFTLFCTGCGVFKSNKQGSASESARTVSKGPSPLYYNFGDVLLPAEIKVNKEESFVYNSNGFSAGVLVLSGRVEANSLIDFFENNMAKDNWKKICSFKSAHTLMLFQKDSRRCVISIHENSFSTHAKVWVAPTVNQAGLGLLK
ncbi:MAG: hypothetical protein J7K84_09320 [Deltaproteobacteria bacterium]|nr:hypothetical protein [Deltaproteobacteria bacterium]